MAREVGDNRLLRLIGNYMCAGVTVDLEKNEAVYVALQEHLSLLNFKQERTSPASASTCVTKR